VLVDDNFHKWAEREMAPHQDLLKTMRAMQLQIAQKCKTLCNFLMEQWEEKELQFDAREGIDGVSKKPMCPVAKPMHLLQRLLHDISMVVSVASNTAHLVQKDRARRTGETAWSAEEAEDLFKECEEEYNLELELSTKNIVLPSIAELMAKDAAGHEKTAVKGQGTMLGGY